MDVTFPPTHLRASKKSWLNQEGWSYFQMKWVGVIFALLFLPLGLLHAENVWLNNFEAAQIQAQQEKKVIFALFTGSTWCPPCIMMEREIFQTTDFQSYAAQNLVLLKFDFPKSFNPNSPEYQVSLLRRYGVEGFPTVLILDPEGKVLRQMGYRRQSVSNLIEEIQSVSPGSQDSSPPDLSRYLNVWTLLGAGFFFFLILPPLSFLVWHQTQNAELKKKKFVLPNARHNVAEFLGNRERYTSDSHYIYMAGSRYSLKNATYDPFTFTLTLQTGTRIKFIPQR